MGESGDILICPVILLVVHVRLARGTPTGLTIARHQWRAVSGQWRLTTPTKHLLTLTKANLGASDNVFHLQTQKCDICPT